MKPRTTSLASLSCLLIATPLTLTLPAHAAQAWHAGWCARDEGLSVVVDYGGIADPSIPDTGWEARCLVGGRIDAGADATRVAALKAVGFTVSGSGSYVEGINGVHEFDHGSSWWMFSGATVPGTWSTTSYDISAGTNVAIGAKYVVEGNGDTPRPAPQFATVTGPGGPSTPTGPTAPAVQGGKPTVVGSARVGRRLTASTGVWTAGATLTYQWLRNGTAIAGATMSRYTLTAADRGKKVSIRVTGTSTGRPSATLTSTAVGVVAGTITGTKPRITGTTRQGKKLTVKAGVWGPQPVTRTYQWLRNGKAIKGATRTSYRLKAVDRGTRLSVRVRATKAGYTAKALTSVRTTKITR